jgi:hybrid polyketide synthase/nonribosomal peptide synthetase FtdB
MTKETFDKVYDAKTVTHWSLHKLFQDLEMDFFIMFSSVAALIAAPGQANYASANAFVDALSLHRRRVGLPSLSIAWGPWATGMIKRLNLEQLYVEKGIQPIAEKNGVQVMYRLIGQNIGYAAVAEVNWDRVLEIGLRSKTPYLDHLRSQDGADVEAILSDSEKHKIFIEKFMAADETGQRLLIDEEWKTLIGNSLRIKKDNIDPSAALVEMGMDSMLAVEISNRIGLLFGVNITLIDLISAISIESLSARIFDELKAIHEVQSEEELLASVTEGELRELLEEIDELSAEY